MARMEQWRNHHGMLPGYTCRTLAFSNEYLYATDSIAESRHRQVDIVQNQVKCMCRNTLKLPSAEILEAYRQLVVELEEKIAEISSTSLHAPLRCGPGCDGCCMQFSVLPVEAALIAQAVAAKGLSLENNQKTCVLLKDGLCSIYDLRPVICRTQGLPLAYIDEEAGAIEVSACPLNFPDDYPLSHEELLYMDPFNGRLAELNVRYCRENDLDPEKRIPLAACLAAQSGAS